MLLTCLEAEASMDERTIDSDVAILGGGFAGLALAYLLGKEGLRVALLEKAQSLAGLVGTFSIEGTPLEMYYHHMFTTDHVLMALLDELGIAEKFKERKSSMGLYAKGQFYALNSPLDLLRCGALPPFARFRFGLTTLRLSRQRSEEELDRIPAVDWLFKTYGKAATELIWIPLLRSKFGEYGDQISAAWIFERVAKRAQSRNRSSSRETLIYPDGSYRILFERLIEEIEHQGGMLLCNAPTEEIRFDEDGSVIGVRGGTVEVNARYAVTTIPAPLMGRVLAASQSSVSDGQKSKVAKVQAAFEQIHYQGCVVMILKAKRRFFPFYWNTIADHRMPFSVVVAQTELVPPEAYGGKHVYYLGAYTNADDPLFQMGNDEALDTFLPHLQQLNAELTRDEIEDFYLFRSRFATPVFTTGFRDLMPPIKSPIQGLYNCSNAQIYPFSRNLDSTLRVVQETVETIVADVKQGKT